MTISEKTPTVPHPVFDHLEQWEIQTTSASMGQLIPYGIKTYGMG